MISVQFKILTKLLLDLTYFFLVFSVYFSDIFKYMKTNHIGITELSIKTKIDGVLGVGKFESFEDHWCDQLGSQDIICDNIDRWKKAGILFIVFTTFSHVFLIFGIANLIAKSCLCSFKLGILKDTENFIYPAFYCLSLLCYVLVSKVFTLDKPMYYNNEYNVKAEHGIVMMFVALCFCLISPLFFMFNRAEINKFCEVAGKESFLLKNIEQA